MIGKSPRSPLDNREPLAKLDIGQSSSNYRNLPAEELETTYVLMDNQ